MIRLSQRLFIASLFCWICIAETSNSTDSSAIVPVSSAIEPQELQELDNINVSILESVPTSANSCSESSCSTSSTRSTNFFAPQIMTNPTTSSRTTIQSDFVTTIEENIHSSAHVVILEEQNSDKEECDSSKEDTSAELPVETEPDSEITQATTAKPNDVTQEETHDLLINDLQANASIDISSIQLLDQSTNIDIDTNVSNSTVDQQNNTTNVTIDDCRFMSFEEWKKQKEEADISQEQQNYANTTKVSSKAKNTTSNELSIHGDVPPKVPSVAAEQNVTKEEGRVYKDKFNYASVGCAATIIKTNSEAKGASAILVENKDSYLLNVCSAPSKFVVIELCQDILVDSVVMGNFEFFSSMFKDIRVSVSDRFPTTSWKLLGEFEAENVRDVQNFKIANPFIWARYLKVEILSHYGDEFYCPISVIRVHGKTMMEDFKEEEEVSQLQKEQEELVIDTASLDKFDNDTLEECRVILPHLGLNQFLQDYNNTSEEFCEVLETGQAQTTEASATTQESVYRNIIKRLSLLESNATLSLLYIEEQSKLLSTAFSNLERRQTSNFESLVNSVNSTLISQLISFKNSYLNMHSEYAKLFKLQENNHKELLNESRTKIGALGNELTFQKRVAIFNSIIIICLLVYVVLTRDAYISEEIVEVTRSSSGARTKNNKKAYPTGLLKKNFKPKHKKKNSSTFPHF
ncbi:UNC-like C-terminal-domain-containing protein [Scheffersomyces xylosifermentans]|uniref:UNC-like C-terminal-domain-containing protein n=1 Tax=Scheffersomyces xylosifermentans TaxID=1304137 RepID=UPI00315D8709